MPASSGEICEVSNPGRSTRFSIIRGENDLPGTKTVMKSGTMLGDDCCRFALPIIQRQLAKAGTRIAWTLNKISRMNNDNITEWYYSSGIVATFDRDRLFEIALPPRPHNRLGTMKLRDLSTSWPATGTTVKGLK